VPLDDFTPTSEAHPAGNEVLPPARRPRKEKAHGEMKPCMLLASSAPAARLPKLVTSLVHANKKFLRQANLHAQQK